MQQTHHHHFIDSKTIHQRIEQIARHRVAIVAVMAFMFVALARFDARISTVMQQAYNQGFGWIGTYMHHEPHPMHAHLSVAITRIPTISGN
jgi:hypothetical protein